MAWEWIIALMVGGLIGWIVGSLGGGGSILIIPALNIIFHLDIKEAIPPAVLIVGITSLFATMLHWRHGSVNYRLAAMFAGSGLLGIWLGQNARQTIEENVLKGVLAGILLVSAALMLRSSQNNSSSEKAANGNGNGKNGTQFERIALVLVVGWAVGFLTSFLGVTAGFIIVPALTLLAKLPIHQAIGTSLAIITLNCGSTLYSEMDRNWDWAFLLPFIIGSLSVTSIAVKVAKSLSEAKQKKRFAVLSLGVAIFMLVQILFSLASVESNDSSQVAAPKGTKTVSRR